MSEMMLKKTIQNDRSRLYIFLLAMAAYFILVTIADIYPLKGEGERLIGHADEASFAILARNMAEGKGAVVDVVWLLRGGGMQYASLTHPEDYWSIYSAAFVSLFFSWLGSSKLTLLLAASVVKSLIAIISALWVWRLSKGSLLATTAIIIFVTLSPSMISAVAGLSDIYLTAGMLLSLSAFTLAMSTRRAFWFAITGLFAGVAIGVKPSGSLLLGVPLFMLMYNPKPLLYKFNVLYLLLGLTLGCSWLILHNYQSYGHLNPFTPPAYKLVSAAAQLQKNMVSHDAAMYDPTALELLKFNGTLLNTIHFKLYDIKVWIKDGLQQGEVLPPLLLVFFLAFFWDRKKEFAKFAPDLTEENTFALVAMLMFCAGLTLLLAIHYEARYWNFLFPFVAIVATLSIYRTSRTILVLLILFSVVFGFATYQNRENKLAPPVYRQIVQYISSDKVAMINDPWQFTFHTRIKSVMAPVTYDETAIRRLADKYRVDYLVIIKGQVRHQIYRDIFDGVNHPNWLCPSVKTDDLYIGRFDTENCLDEAVIRAKGN